MNAPRHVIYEAEHTARLFHNSRAFFRGIRGPLGSGKSVTCCWEVYLKAVAQAPFEGVRRSRWAIVRSTYPELKTTTIKTWMDWFGASTKLTWSYPISGWLTGRHPDSTRVECELIFLALRGEKDVEKLKSLELTGIFFNEASEIDREIINMATGRVNRYPAKVKGGPSWSGIIADTNSPDYDNWWYQLAEEEKPEGYEFFDQPPALIREAYEEDGQTRYRYLENPAAENIIHQPAGFNYYHLQIPGKTLDWVNVFICNRYGRSTSGQNIYYSFAREKHVCEDVAFIPARPILWSHDFNLAPGKPMSSIMAQAWRGDDGAMHLDCFDEVVIESADTNDAVAEFKGRPWMAQAQKGVIVYGDASGKSGDTRSKTTDYGLLARAGFREQKVPASNPPIRTRHNTVNALLQDATGRTRIRIHPRCKTLIRGLECARFKQGAQYVEDDSLPEQHITTALGYLCCAEPGLRLPGR